MPQPTSTARFDRALSEWACCELALAAITSRGVLSGVLRTRECERRDEVMHCLLRRPCRKEPDGLLAAELVVDAMLLSYRVSWGECSALSRLLRGRSALAAA